MLSSGRGRRRDSVYIRGPIADFRRGGQLELRDSFSGLAMVVRAMVCHPRHWEFKEA